MLSLYQLQIFLLVAQVKTVSAAAEQIHLTQPAVSLQIRSLERALQLDLFVRRGHRMDPTPAGKALLPIARDLVQLGEQAEELVETIRSGGSPARGRWRHRLSLAQAVMQTAGAEIEAYLRLGCGTEFGLEGIYRVVGAFRRAFPAVVVSVEHEPADLALKRIKEKSLDVALVDQRPRERGLRSQRVLTDEIVLVVPARHPWAERGSIPAEELAGQSFVARSSTVEWRLAAEALDRRRIQIADLPISVHVDTPHDAIAAVGQGLGISFVAKGFAQGSSGKAVAVPIDGVTIRRDVFLVHRAEDAQTEAKRRLEAFLRSPQAAKLLAGEG